MRPHKKAVGITALTVIGLLELADRVEIIKSHLPKWLTTMNSEPWVIAILIGLCLYFILTHAEKESEGAPSSLPGEVNVRQESKVGRSESTSTGGVATGIGSFIINTHPPAENAEVQLSITCEIVTLPMGYSGHLWILNTLGFSCGLMKLSAPPKNPNGLWPEDGVYGTGYKCTVKNYGSRTAFGVSMYLDTTVLDWVQLSPTSWGDGQPKKRHTSEVFIPVPLGPQGSDQFSFYICSYDPESSLSIRVPLTGSINSDDPKNKQQVPIRLTAIENPLSIPAKLITRP
jgi:hypothetical protein